MDEQQVDRSVLASVGITLSLRSNDGLSIVANFRHGHLQTITIGFAEGWPEEGSGMPEHEALTSIRAFMEWCLKEVVGQQDVFLDLMDTLVKAGIEIEIAEHKGREQQQENRQREGGKGE